MGLEALKHGPEMHLHLKAGWTTRNLQKKTGKMGLEGGKRAAAQSGVLGAGEDAA